MRRRRDTGDHRDRLVEAARRVFSRIDLADATIDDILGEAGSSRATFYGYFASKYEIFQQVVLVVREEMRAAGTAASPMPEPHMISPDLLRPLVANFASARIQHWRDEPVLMRAIVVFLATASPEAARSTRLDDASSARFIRAIAHDRDAGLVRPEIDPRLAAAAFDAMVEWVCFSAFGQGLVSLEHLSDAEIAQNIADIWIHGIYHSTATSG